MRLIIKSYYIRWNAFPSLISPLFYCCCMLHYGFPHAKTIFHFSDKFHLVYNPFYMLLWISGFEHFCVHWPLLLFHAHMSGFGMSPTRYIEWVKSVTPSYIFERFAEILLLILVQRFGRIYQRNHLGLDCLLQGFFKKIITNSICLLIWGLFRFSMFCPDFLILLEAVSIACVFL